MSAKAFVCLSLSLSLLGLELGSLTPFIRPIFPLRPSTSVSRSKDGSIVSWMSPPPPPPPPLPKRFCLSRNPSLFKTKHDQRKRERERYNPYPGRSRSGQVKAKSGPPKRVERSRVVSWGSALLHQGPSAPHSLVPRLELTFRTMPWPPQSSPSRSRFFRFLRHSFRIHFIPFPPTHQNQGPPSNTVFNVGAGVQSEQRGKGEDGRERRPPSSSQ